MAKKMGLDKRQVHEFTTDSETHQRVLSKVNTLITLGGKGIHNVNIQNGGMFYDDGSPVDLLTEHWVVDRVAQMDMDAEAAGRRSIKDITGLDVYAEAKRVLQEEEQQVKAAKEEEKKTKAAKKKEAEAADEQLAPLQFSESEG